MSSNISLARPRAARPSAQEAPKIWGPRAPLPASMIGRAPAGHGGVYGEKWPENGGKMWKNGEKNVENQTTWETNGETHENGVKNGKGWHRMVKNGWIFGWYRELFGDLYRISPANKNSGWFRIYINDKFGIWPTTNQKSWVVLFSGFKVISGNKSSEAYVRKLTPFGQQRMNRPIGYINCHHVPAKKMRLAPPLF